MDSQEEPISNNISPDTKERLNIIDALTMSEGMNIFTPVQSKGAISLESPGVTPLMDKSINIAAMTRKQLQRLGVDVVDQQKHQSWYCIYPVLERVTFLFHFKFLI